MVECTSGGVYTRWCVYTASIHTVGLTHGGEIQGGTSIRRRLTHGGNIQMEGHEEGYTHGGTYTVVHLHDRTYTRRGHTHGEIYTMRRYTLQGPNIRREIHTE